MEITWSGLTYMVPSNPNRHIIILPRTTQTRHLVTIEQDGVDNKEYVIYIPIVLIMYWPIQNALAK